MANCPHCNEDMGTNTNEHHICGDRYYRELCPDTYQCTICGNIQNNTGVCSHCGMMLDCTHDHCPYCGCCEDKCHCSCCCSE